MANFGAFSRDFAGAAVKAFNTVSDSLNTSARTELAQNADKRAAASAGREAQSYEDERAAAAAEFGGEPSLAAKAAVPAANTSAIPAPSGGGVTPTGEPALPGETFKPALKAEAAPAPAAAPAPRSGIPASLRSAAAGGNVAAQKRIRAMEEAALEQSNKERDFGIRSGQLQNQTRQVDDQLENSKVTRATTTQALTEDTYKFAKIKAQEASKQAFSIIDSLKGKEAVSVSDPSVGPQVAQLQDVLKQGYDATPDGRTIDVKNTPKGIVVTTIDERTGKPVGPPDVFSTVGDLQKATMMFGQMTQGENLGAWIAATKADTITNKVRGTEAEAAVGSVRDKVAKATAEQRLDPVWQLQTEKEIAVIEDQYGKLVMEETEVPVPNPAYDPSQPSSLDNSPELINPETNKPVTRKVMQSQLRDMAKLLQPDTTIVGPNGQRSDAANAVQKFVADPTPFIKATGSLPAALEALTADLVAKGLSEETATVLVQRAVPQLQESLQQKLKTVAQPRALGPINPQSIMSPNAPRPTGIPTK